MTEPKKKVKKNRLLTDYGKLKLARKLLREAMDMMGDVMRNVVEPPSPKKEKRERGRL